MASIEINWRGPVLRLDAKKPSGSEGFFVGLATRKQETKLST